MDVEALYGTESYRTKNAGMAALRLLIVWTTMKNTTFEDFQIDERFKKLEYSLKMAVLKKAHNDNEKVLPVAKNQPSISNTNLDSLDSSCMIPSLQTSMVQSEVLASSNNLRNLLLTKKNYKTNQKIMASSSIKQYNIKQDNHSNDQHIMPPPMRNTVYCTSKKTLGKVPTLSNYETAASNLVDRSAQSFILKNTSSLNSAARCVPTNTSINKEYLQSLAVPMLLTNHLQRVDRIFSKWKVMLNSHYELLIKGTLECGKVAHSKPIIRRYSATCVESKYKNIYSLQGNIVDTTNALPDYIRGKFYNGFPDDWENVYQIWRTYVRQGCRVTFRWPTPITDSDDDLKSELTDLTCMRTTNSKIIPMEINESIEYIKPENPNGKSLKNEEKYHNCPTHSFQRHDENTSFVKPLTSNFEKDIISITQTGNIMSVHNENNKQNIKLDINPMIDFRGINKLKDFIHEDKLHVMINNLADRNCSPKYIDKIIEMLECLDYIVSYRAKSECTDDSAIFVNCGTSSKPETIPLQSSFSCDDNCMKTNKFKDDIIKQWKNYTHPTDLRYGSIKNDSNSTQLLNPVNIKPKHYNNDSDESESETYMGVPKISKIERVLYARKAFRKLYNHKVRKKRENPQYNTKEIENKSEYAHAAIPFADDNKSLLSAESDISIPKDEAKMINTRTYSEIINIERSREDSFCSHPWKNNFDVYGANEPAMQTEQPPDAFKAQRVNLNVLAKEQKVLHKIQENAHSQFVADINYATNFDDDIKIISTNTQKRNGNMIASHSNLKQDIVISSENNNNFLEKSPILRESHREFIEQSRSETAMKRSKPNIISSIPVNLKLKIKKADFKPEQLQDLDVNIVEIEENKQCTNIQPLEHVQKKKSVSKMPTEATFANSSYLPMATNNKIYPTMNKDTNPTNLTNSSIEQSKRNKLEDKNNPKVLCAWMPKITYYAKSKFELGLTFEGNLLNEAGYVVHRKFTTDIVLKRLSATLIETVNHEFYKLSGYLKDNKHVIPKELAKQCHNGCPANIKDFCLTWKRLENCEKMSKISHNVSMDSLNTSVSSRGRRIVPPLSYWTGERITLKDNNLVYDPGNTQESSLYSVINSSKLNTEKIKKQKVNFTNTSKEEKRLSKWNESPGTNKNQTIVIKKTQSSDKLPMTKAANSRKRSNKSQKFQINKRHIKQDLTFSSINSSEEEQNVSQLKRMRTRPSTKTKAPQYSMTLRKRHEIDASPNTTKLQYSLRKKTRHNMTCTYYKDILPAEDFLSEVTSM